jgi:hypothetical protein
MALCPKTLRAWPLLELFGNKTGTPNIFPAQKAPGNWLINSLLPGARRRKGKVSLRITSWQ